MLPTPNRLLTAPRPRYGAQTLQAAPQQHYSIEENKENALRATTLQDTDQLKHKFHSLTLKSKEITCESQKIFTHVESTCR
jgi:hypothetical protein